MKKKKNKQKLSGSINDGHLIRFFFFFVYIRWAIITIIIIIIFIVVCKCPSDIIIIIFYNINVKKIAFGNKEHTTDKKMGVSVLLRLLKSSNEVCNTAYALWRIHEQNAIFKDSIIGPMIPKEMK